MSRKPFGGLTLLALAAVLVGCLSAVGCGNDQKLGKVSTPTTPWPTSTKGPPTATPTITPTSGPPQTIAVTVTDKGFDPDVIDIRVGDTVVWTNNGSQTHWVLANDSTFNSGKLAPGQSYSYTFTEVGQYQYHCEITAYLKGFIMVQ